MKIQIASDLHIDKNIIHIGHMIKPLGDILCLAGDICECTTDRYISLFKEFIQHECSSFKYVFHIAGNHEYYSKKSVTIATVKNKLKELQQIIPNYIFLDNETFTFVLNNQEYVIIGSTLWSMIPDECINYIDRYVYDYRMIYINSTMNITVKDTVQMHKTAVQFIDDVLNVYEKGNTNVILMTHHKPIWDDETNPKHDKLLKPAFESKCEWLIRPPLKLAIFGHTHEVMNTILNGVKIVSNAHGYEHEMENYDNSCIVEI